MANLLSPAILATIKAALQNVVDTFFKAEIVLNLKTTTLDEYGEHPTQTVVNRTFSVLLDYSVGKSGRYEDIEASPMGERDESSFHVYFWATDIENSGIVIDAENTTVTVANIPNIKDGEYEVRLFVPSALFSDLGYLLYEMELKIHGG